MGPIGWYIELAVLICVIVYSTHSLNNDRHLVDMVTFQCIIIWLWDLETFLLLCHLPGTLIHFFYKCNYWIPQTLINVYAIVDLTDLVKDDYSFGRGEMCDYQFNTPQMLKHPCYQAYSKVHFKLTKVRCGVSLQSHLQSLQIYVMLTFKFRIVVFIVVPVFLYSLIRKTYLINVVQRWATLKIVL